MRHQCAAVIGLLTAALVAPVSPSHAASADPTGYWMKPDAERESKIEVFKCGKKKTNLCAKIAWLKEPNDSKGQPLHDVRNENPAMRGRPIMGLPIFTDLVPSAPSTWNGKIYNPEDGRTYTATLTVLSRKQILLKGCKAWLLCGERNWFRTAAPPAEVIAPAEGEQQIEASATPSEPASAEAAVAAEPVVVPSADEAVANTPTAPAAPKEMQATAAPQILVAPSQAEEAEVIPVAVPELPAPSTQATASPVAPPADVNAGGGYGFLAASTDPGAKAPDSGEDVSSMMLMAKPIAAETAATSSAQPVAKTPLPQPMAQPKPPVATEAAEPAAAAVAKPVTSATATPKPAATAAAKPVTTAAAKPAAAAPAKPVTTATATPKPAATAAAKPAAAPAAKPVTTARAKPAAKPETQGETAEQGAATPPDGEAAATTDPNAAETADATPVEAIPLTRRERRMLRKQQREYERAQQDPLLPWLSR
jgi:uncharacterized protein (DUF2147 family)